ncbi:hypothetical protein Hanom_Chr06g00536661 [Helianthus anomalus]
MNTYSGRGSENLINAVISVTKKLSPPVGSSQYSLLINCHRWTSFLLLFSNEIWLVAVVVETLFSAVLLLVICGVLG